MVWFLGCGGYKYRHVYVYVFKASFELMPVELVFFFLKTGSQLVFGMKVRVRILEYPNQTKFIGLWVGG